MHAEPEFAVSRKNRCGVMFRHPEAGTVGCTRLYLHIEAGPCRNHSLNFEWCGMCDSMDCPHIDTWREGRASGIIHELDDELREQRRPDRD